MFFNHVQYYSSDIEQKRIDLISFIEEFFSANEGDSYFIMDPYLEVVKSIQDPCQYDKLEEDNWSYLLSILSYKNVSFKIITRKDLGSIISSDSLPPFKLISLNGLSGATVSVCKYIDTKHMGLSLHDRYIIQEKEGGVKALHFGPSLADIHDKDMSVTVFTENGARKALNSFKDIWVACKNNKGWKKG